jgi:hypothetical protein
MQLADAIREDRLTLDAVAKGIKVANATTVRRYRDGERIPEPATMRAIVEFFEGRVTPTDIYGLAALIEELQARRRRRLARPNEPELPLEVAA